MRGLVTSFSVATLLAFFADTPIDVRGRESIETRSVDVQLFEKWLGRRGVQLVQQELHAIWAPQGIQIVWKCDPFGTGVRIVIDRSESPLPAMGMDGRWNVAAVRYADGHVLPPVYASIDAAERVARSACPPYSSSALEGIIVPRILGRAIAHELAHVLFDTREHSGTGLLRGRFSADELASPVRDPFFLASALSHDAGAAEPPVKFKEPCQWSR